MNTRLVNYSEGRINLAFPMNGSRVTFGREADNVIQLPHPNVSKHHGVLLQTADGWIIEDLKSANGIFVNDKLTARTELKDQDRVKIGPYEFFFETSVPSEDWVPSHIIQMAASIHDRTTIQTKPPGRP